MSKERPPIYFVRHGETDWNVQGLIQGWTDIELPGHVAPGDTVEAESTIRGKRESKSRPNEGILSVETRARNQRGEQILSYRRNLLVYRRDAQTPYAAAGY